MTTMFKPVSTKPRYGQAVKWDGTMQMALDIQKELWLHAAVSHITYVNAGQEHPLRLREEYAIIDPNHSALKLKGDAKAFIEIFEKGKSHRVDVDEWILKDDSGIRIFTDKSFNAMYVPKED